MTLQQLQYILTIAHEGSITKASQVLYKSQPNISKAVKELENELHIHIFKRTSKGVQFTPEGEEFLLKAENIVKQFNQLQNQYQQDCGKTFRISIARSSYMIRGLSRWINNTFEDEERLTIHLVETNTNQVIEDISSGQSDLGIIRISANQQEILDILLEQKYIVQKQLMEFPLYLVFKKEHPLSQYNIVPYDSLKKYTEIIHGDDRILAFQHEQMNSFVHADNEKRKVYVYDRGSQINLLENIKDAYMWVSPIPVDMLKSYDMVLKQCDQTVSKNRDILIYRQANSNIDYINECSAYLIEFASQLKNSTIEYVQNQRE